MSYQTRDWAAAFVAAAADVTTHDREVNQRTKIAWRELPDKQGKDVAMTPIHGQVYQALVANTKLQDMDADCIESDATNSQVALTSMWSVSQTEQALKDLERVGFIHRTRRHNQSSLTTIFRMPGHFGGKRGGTKAADPVEIDVPALANRILGALDREKLTEHIKSGESPNEFSDPSKVMSVDFEMRIEAALHPDFFGYLREHAADRCLIPVQIEYVDAVAECITGVLPTHLRAVRVWPDALCISLTGDKVARKVLRLIKGVEVPFSGFDPDIRERIDLGICLVHAFATGNHAWAKVQASDDPVAALNQVAREEAENADSLWENAKSDHDDDEEDDGEKEYGEEDDDEEDDDFEEDE